MKLKGENANCPQINLLIILFSIQEFRRKVQRRSTECTSKLAFFIDRPSKITKFHNSLEIKNKIT